MKAFLASLALALFFAVGSAGRGLDSRFSATRVARLPSHCGTTARGTLRVLHHLHAGLEAPAKLVANQALAAQTWSNAL